MKKLTLLTICIACFTNSHAQIAGDYLDLNNIKARINSEGSLFWDFYQSQFEVPKGSGHSTIFADNLWVGGIDAGGMLKVAGQTYRQTGTDYWPGPINSSAVYDPANAVHDNRVWKLNKCDIDAFHTWSMGGSVGPLPIDSAAMEAITNWPAFDSEWTPIAPFFDANGDYFYDPNAGDYPLIKGDQAIYFIFNDRAGIHTETGGASIGLQIQGMAYEYNCPDSALQNTVFVDYKIINKSSFTLNQVYIGKWTDMDIGGPYNYMKCDVTRGDFYGYCDTATDSQYGDHQAAQAVLFLKGPFADANGLADPSSSSPNGTGFGDTIIDNEQLGLSKFMSYNNIGGPINGWPSTAQHFYNYLSGSWIDGTPWTYGGNGIGGTTTCDYLYPGNSDPYGFGVHGSPEPAWDEQTAALYPTDQQAVGAAGPFTLLPGAINNLEVAYVFGRDYSTTGGAAAVAVMNERIDSIKTRYANGIMACGCGSGSAGIHTPANTFELSIYPNPASDQLHIQCSSLSKNAVVEIYDVTGQLIKKENINSASKIISINELANGLYILKIVDSEHATSKRFIKN